MGKKAIRKQTSGHLLVGDVLRILDKDQLGEIAVCVESDGHEEYPFACVVLTGKEQERDPVWPSKWIRLGNIVENVALLERERLRLMEVAEARTAREPVYVPFTSIGKSKK